MILFLLLFVCFLSCFVVAVASAAAACHGFYFIDFAEKAKEVFFSFLSCVRGARARARACARVPLCLPYFIS